MNNPNTPSPLFTGDGLDDIKSVDPIDMIGYLNQLFVPGDTVLIQMIHSSETFSTGAIKTNSFADDLESLTVNNTAEAIFDFQQKGWNVFVCMNPVSPETKQRRKQDVAAVRSVYLDIDQDGDAAIAAIMEFVESGVIPDPHFIISSSAGKYYVIWLVEGFNVETQEALNKALQQKFGGDRQATDANRVLRLPGTINLKYPTRPVCKIVRDHDGSRATPADFKILSNVQVVTRVEVADDILEEKVNEVRGFLDWAGITYQEKEAADGGILEVFECPFPHKSGHHMGEAFAGVGTLDSTGNFRFECKHDSCAGIGWKEFRARVQEMKGQQYQFDGTAIKEKNTPLIGGTPAGTGIPPTTAVATNGQVVVDDVGEEIAEEEIVLPPFPKFTGSLAELADAMSPDIPWAFKFVAAVTHFGIDRSGLDTLDTERHIQPRFYAALVAEPGRGKTAAINEVRKIMRNILYRYATPPSIDSGPALVDAFADQRSSAPEVGSEDIPASKVLLDPDELKDLFEKGRSTLTTKGTMLNELLKLYEGNRTGNRIRNNKNPIKIQLDNAHLAIIGGATVADYAKMWIGTGGASDGLQSRVIPVGINCAKMPSRQRPADSEKLNIVIQKLLRQSKASARLIAISEPAFQMFDSWWEAKDQKKASIVRIDGIVKRLLIVLAATNDTLEVDEHLMSQGIAFGDFIIACRDLYNPADASTWTQSFENCIIAVHQKHGELSPNKCRRLVHPERKPGGMGPFLQAYNNLVKAGVLRKSSQTQRSGVYRLTL